jgi:hypothetical protein
VGEPVHQGRRELGGSARQYGGTSKGHWHFVRSQLTETEVEGSGAETTCSCPVWEDCAAPILMMRR